MTPPNNNNYDVVTYTIPVANPKHNHTLTLMYVETLHTYFTLITISSFNIKSDPDMQITLKHPKLVPLCHCSAVGRAKKEGGNPYSG